jgi:hypothetical protein
MIPSDSIHPDAPAAGYGTGAFRSAGPLGIHGKPEKWGQPGSLGLADTGPSAAVRRLVAAQDAAIRNPKFAPDPVSGTTHCSEAARYIDEATGRHGAGVLGETDGDNFLANAQIAKLAAHGSGYHVVLAESAQALADQGVTVWVTQLGHAHGHIASVRPEGVPGDRPRGKTGLLLANIGLFNGVAHQSAVFTPAHGAVVCYAPD